MQLFMCCPIQNKEVTVVYWFMNTFAQTAHIFPFSSLTSLLILPCILPFTSWRKEPQKRITQYLHMISFLNGNNDDNNKHLLTNLLCQTPCHNWHYLTLGVPMNCRSTYQGFEFPRLDMGSCHRVVNSVFY